MTSGETFKLTAFGVGQPFLRYQWQRNGDDLIGATNASLSITAAILADAGAYRCVITNALGAVTSAVANISITGMAAPRFDTQTAPPWLGTNGFQMQVSDLSGLGPLVIYASSNLVNWLPIFTNPASSDAVIFNDSDATNLPQRFYRAGEAR